MSPQDSDDELLQAFRRASAEEAGRPAESTRRAILAEAAAATRRRTPAANDSRFRWSAVAGVAVLGVAVLLWRQADYQLPTEPPLVTVAPVMERAPEAVAEPPPVPVAAPVPAPPPPARVAQAPRPAPAAESQTKAEEPGVAADIAANAQAERAIAAAPAAAQRARETSTTAQLLQQHFPAQYRSDAPPRALWLVLDAAGQHMRSGELAAQDSLDSIGATVARELGTDDIGPWLTETVSSARGVPIELAVARLP